MALVASRRSARADLAVRWRGGSVRAMESADWKVAGMEMTNRMSEAGLDALREIDDGLAANAARHIELLQGENDALRELLKEARECVQFRADERWIEDDQRLLDRIDAALKKYG